MVLTATTGGDAITLERRLFGAGDDSREAGAEDNQENSTAASWRKSESGSVAANRGVRLRAAIGDALEREADRGARFLLVPVLIGVGAIVYFRLPNEPSWALIAVAAAASALFFAVSRGRPGANALFAAFSLIIVGLIAAKAETSNAATRMLGSEISTRLTGEVRTIERLANGRARLTIDVIATVRPTLRYAPDRVRVTARSLPAGLTAGSTIEGVVRLFPPSGPVRPQSYDFAFESYFDGRGATGFFLRDPVAIAVATESSLADRAHLVVERFRDRLAARIRSTIGGAEGEIAAALIAGVRGGIPEPANEALRVSGLAHVLSISGLHMALVAATVMVSLRAGFALFPVFASRRPVKKYAAALALLVAAAYLIVSGAEVAAQRSFIMLAVMLVALLFDQAAITMRNLAIAATLILLMSPHEIVGPSFQMSFAATAALIGGYAAWSGRMTGRPARKPGMFGQAGVGRVAGTIARYGLGLAMTSIVAGLATTLFAVWHFQRVSPLSLFANLAAMPIVSVLVMPFAVAAMAAMPFGLDGGFLAVMGVGLGFMLDIAHWFAERTPLDAVGQIPVSGVCLLTAALLVATLATTALRIAALPLAAAGFMLIATRDLPDVYISEDARLVGVRMGDGALAINRKRPDQFALQNWMRAANTATTTMPSVGRGVAKGGEQGKIGGNGAPAPAASKTGLPSGAEEKPSGFQCDDGLCLVAAPGGFLVAHIAAGHVIPKADLVRVCATASVVIVEDAAAPLACPGSDIAVITAQALARQGSVEIRFRSGAEPDIAYSIAEPFRPWHAHRAFSREARGLAPWRPQKPASTTPPAAASDAISSAE